MDSERIVLGSGKVYCMLFTGTIPDDATIETSENQIGHVKGGASLEYKPESYTAEDDMGVVSKTRLTKEEVTFKTGIITWCATTLKKLCQTARVTTENNKRSIKIGGINNQNNEKYLIRFLHEDSEDGNIRVTIVGSNEAGFSLTFAKDAETTVDAEFKAKPLDTEGTLVILKEDIPTQV